MDRRDEKLKKMFPKWLKKDDAGYRRCVVKWRLQGWQTSWDLFQALGKNLPVLYIHDNTTIEDPHPWRQRNVFLPLARYLYSEVHDKFRLTNYKDADGHWVDVAGGTR